MGPEFWCPFDSSDRGAQFTSTIFQQLAKTWGVKTIQTTPYHPEANGLVERFHRRLKEALLALGADEPEDWFWRLPCVMLSIRTTLKPDVGASPADLVYGKGLAVPGELLPPNPAMESKLAHQRAAALADLRIEVSRLQPVQTSAHRRPLVHIPEGLDQCTHVFVRRGASGPNATLLSPYVGPFCVVAQNTVNFKVLVPGRGDETGLHLKGKTCVVLHTRCRRGRAPAPAASWPTTATPSTTSTASSRLSSQSGRSGTTVPSYQKVCSARKSPSTSERQRGRASSSTNAASSFTAAATS